MSAGDHRLFALAQRARPPARAPRQGRAAEGRATLKPCWGDEFRAAPARARAASAPVGGWDLEGEEIPLPEALRIGSAAARAHAASEETDWTVPPPASAADESAADEEQDTEAQEESEDEGDAEAQTLSGAALEREVMSLTARTAPIRAAPQDDESPEDEAPAEPMSMPQAPAGGHSVFDGMRMGLHAPHTFALGVFDIDTQLDRIERALGAERRAQNEGKASRPPASALSAADVEAEIRAMQPQATTDRSNDHGRETA